MWTAWAPFFLFSSGMQETSWFILPAALPGKHYSVTSRIHTEKTADHYHPSLFESRISRCAKVARKSNEDRRGAPTHINYFACPYHHHPNFKNCFWATLTFESKHFRKVYYTCRKMHKSHPLFTKWTHPCNQHQTKTQMIPAPQKALSCVFRALCSAQINFLKGLSLIFLSITLWKRGQELSLTLFYK